MTDDARSNAKLAAARTPLPVRVCDTCGKLYQPDRISGRFCAEKCKRAFFRYVLPPRPCERCGARFVAPDSNPKQRFCCNRCSYDARVPTLSARSCASCSKTFQPRRDEQQTCGKACGYALRRGSSADVKRRPCPECGTLFVARTTSVYCGRACAGLAKQRLQDRQITVICEVCGTNFKAKRSRTAVKFCSNACRGATSLHPFKLHVAKASAARDFLLSLDLYPKGPLSTASQRRNAALAYVRQVGLL